jgi:hypothetical protein
MRTNAHDHAYGLRGVELSPAGQCFPQLPGAYGDIRGGGPAGH